MTLAIFASVLFGFIEEAIFECPYFDIFADVLLLSFEIFKKYFRYEPFVILQFANIFSSLSFINPLNGVFDRVKDFYPFTLVCVIFVLKWIS